MIIKVKTNDIYKLAVDLERYIARELMTYGYVSVNEITNYISGVSNIPDKDTGYNMAWGIPAVHVVWGSNCTISILPEPKNEYWRLW